MKKTAYIVLALLVSSCASGGYKPNYIMTHKEAQVPNLSREAQDSSPLGDSIAD